MPRCFIMYREKDFSGVSGTGAVLEGVVFSSGKTIAQWRDSPTLKGSTVIYDSFNDFYGIHVASHPDNETRIEFIDGETLSQ